MSLPLYADDEFIQPRELAEAFHTTIREVAEVSGLSPDAISKQSRLRSRASQKRLRDMMLIINRASHWCGSPFQAYAWYRSEPLPSFGDLTAEDLVKAGKARQVMDYLSRIAEGGYA